jgi:hypothetical protein
MNPFLSPFIFMHTAITTSYINAIWVKLHENFVLDVCTKQAFGYYCFLQYYP